VIHEGADTEQFATAKKHIEWAQRVYFLGFGYHATNLGRLGVPESLKAKSPICGTTYGLTDQELYLVNKRLGRKLMDVGRGCDTLEFLRHAPPLDG
jgi:hypothetical protein